MKKPNFFIIGMPKCGTTALSEYLRAHPNVFIPASKELRYFLPENFKFIRENTFKHYLENFKGVKEYHLAIGEATPSYCMHMSAIKKILQYCPEAKFIIMLRNPVERFFSLYKQLRFYGVEKSSTPRAVLERMQSLTVKEPHDNQYLKLRLSSSYMEELLKLINKKRLHVILFDEFKHQAKITYEQVLNFLQVPIISKQTFPRINQSIVIGQSTIQKFITLLHRLHWFLKKHIRLNSVFCLFIIRRIKKFCARLSVDEKTDLSDPLIFELSDYFKEDVYKLANLLNNKKILSWIKHQEIN
jgi:hypothetical protein